MGADLGDPTIFDERDAIGAADGRQAMGDHQRRAVLHRMVEGSLDQGFVLVVQMAGRLIEHHDRRVLQEQPGDRKALLLATAQPIAAFADDGVVAVGQRRDRVVDAGSLRGSNQLVVGGVERGVTQVVADGLVEQVRVLRHHTDRGTQ